MVTVLITGMGSTTAISVLKGLRRQSEIAVRIIGVDINQATQIAGSSFCDKFYTVPKAVDPQYIPSLLQICVSEGVQILFPIVDIELEMLAGVRDMFREHGVHVWVSCPETVLTCNDKYQTYQFFRRHDIATPQTWTADEAVTRLADLRYPLVVKPARGVSSIGVSVVHTMPELTAALEQADQPIVQEYLSGPEYTVDVLMDEESRPIAVVPRERIEVKAGISYKGRTVRHEGLMREATRIATALRIEGPCNIQCRIPNDTPIFFEVNPRFSGTLPLTVAAGVNSPILLVQRTSGRLPARLPLPFKAGVYMARYWEEVFYEIDSDTGGEAGRRAAGVLE